MLDHPALLLAARAGHFVLHPMVFRALVVAAVLLGRLRRPAVTSVAVLVTLVVGGLLGAGLKLWIGRPRPSFPDPVSDFSGYSMPSAHALNAALGVGLLLWLAWPALRHRLWWVAAGVLVVVVTGLDRVLLGAHYPSDVLAGWAVGAVTVVVGWALTRPVRRRGPGPGGDDEPP